VLLLHFPARETNLLIKLIIQIANLEALFCTLVMNLMMQNGVCTGATIDRDRFIDANQRSSGTSCCAAVTSTLQTHQGNIIGNLNTMFVDNDDSPSTNTN
jgi:hypothetical protein